MGGRRREAAESRVLWVGGSRLGDICKVPLSEVLNSSSRGSHSWCSTRGLPGSEGVPRTRFKAFLLAAIISE